MSPLAGIRHFLASHTVMSSSTHQQSQDFPAIPSVLNAQDHEMRDYYADHPDADTPPPNTAPYYTPYLGLRARLSQTWINRWTVLILLVIFRLIIAIGSLNKDIASAKSEALSACTSVENVGSAMASMPHYLSQGVNAVAADGITKAVGGLMDMLMLTLSGVEDIVIFVINMMTSTYTCLITLAITGSLEVAIEMIEDVASFMNKSISTITGDMDSVVSTFQNSLNSFLKDIDIGGLLGGSKNPPSIDLTSFIDKLNNITIDPTTMDSDLQKLNDSLPTFGDVQNFTNTAISLPFEEVKKLVNQSLGTYTFDHSIFPVPEKKSLTFCSNNSDVNDFFGDIVDAIYIARKVFIIVLSIAAILACIPMAYREIWSWRSTLSRSTLLKKHAFDPVDVLYIAQRPYTSTAGIKAAEKIRSTKRQILMRWFVAYSTTLPALFVLSLGVTGLFTSLCQYVVLRLLEKEVPVLAAAIGDFAQEVVSTLEDASTEWANGANAIINSTNAKVNSDVFGWVNTTTSAVNNTLNIFTDDLSLALNKTFGGTPLYNPIQDVIGCLIGLKIAGIQKGLTWVSDHAHVTFPEFRTDVFSLGAAASIANSSSTNSFLANPGAVASDDITSALVKVGDKLQEAIRQEALIAAFLVGVFFLNMLIGAIRAGIAMYGRDKTRAEGGPRTYTGDNRVALSPRTQQQAYAGAEGLFPQFGAHTTGVTPVDQPSDNEENANSWKTPDDGFENEKLGVGSVRGNRVEVGRGHERTSSYGFLVDEKR